MNDQTDHTSMLTGSEVLSLASVRGIYSEVSAHVKEKSKVVPTTSVAETLSEIQGLFNESQKIAYVGLCYTLIYNYKRSRFTSKNADKRALVQYEKWSLEYMEKIFVYLEFTTKGKLIMLMERKKFNSEFSISWSTAKRFGFKFDKGCKRRTKGCRKR
jgi:hypothetical protein